MGQNVFYNILRGLNTDISTHGIWREMIKVEKVASEPGTTVIFLLYEAFTLPGDLLSISVV